LGACLSVELGRPFRLMWWATGLSAVGDGMVLVGFPLLALRYTHDPLAISGVAVAGRLPALVVALPAGALADRFNRRRLAVAIELVRLAVLAAFVAVVLLGRDGLAAIFPTVVVLGSLTVAFDVVASAALPSLVAPDQLLSANARLLSAELTGEEVVGRAAGGLALAVATAAPFLADAASFVVSAALVRTAIPDHRQAPVSSSLGRQIIDGLRWMAREPVLRRMLLTMTCLAFFQSAVLSVLPLYATRTLHLHAAGYGLMLGVSGLGNLLGARAATPLHRRLSTTATVALGAALASATYITLAETRSAYIAGAALLLETAAVIIGNVAMRSVRQSTTPPELQGRTASAFQTAVLTALPLGGVLGGLLAARAGISRTYLAAAVAQLVAIALLMRPRAGITAQAGGPGTRKLAHGGAQWSIEETAPRRDGSADA